MAKKNAKDYVIKLKAGVVIRYRGRVLLIRERHNPAHQYRWNIIKGTFEPGKDPSLLEAAVREAREEASAKIKIMWLLSTYYLLDGKNALMMFTFIADLLDRRVKVLPEKLQAKYSKRERITEVKFFTKKELIRLKPEDFVGMRGYLAIRDYLQGKRFSLKVLTTLPAKDSKIDSQKKRR